ncbi:MAG: DUF3320 domain-containing protein [Saccharofermentans sp.]|nr:DUF3320 domain-containing protein [Saccharofermentans sp.]
MADEPFEPYQTANVVLPEMTSAQFCSAVNTRVILSAVKQIVEEESPICFDQIVARLTGSCGIKRMTPNVKEKVDYVLKMGKFPSTIQNITLNKDPENDVAFYWKDAEDAHKIPARFRVGELHATQVTTNEAARAAIYVCKTQYGLPREALITEAGKAMGFKVASGYAKLLIDQAIDLAIDMGELTEHGFNVRYKCE